MSKKTPIVVLSLAALALVPGVATACHTMVSSGTNLPNLGDWEEKLFLYAESDGKPFIALDPDAGTANEATVFAQSTGPQQTAQGFAGQTPASTQILGKAPLAADFYLNLSKPVIGIFYWSSSTAASPGRDAIQFRIELLANDQRVAAEECVFSAQGAITAWNKAMFRVRPEAPLLSAGDVLSLRVTRLSGASDFKIGTGGSQQSFLELHGYSFDPLQGTVYLENRRLVGLPGPGGEAQTRDKPHEHGFFEAEEGAVSIEAPTPAPSDVASTIVFAPLVLIGGLALNRRTRPVPILLALIAVGFAGCMGDPAVPQESEQTDPDEVQPTIVANFTEDKDLASNKTGAIRGAVHDENRIPVGGVHITLIGTSQFRDTDSHGKFEFPNVTAGSYLLRADKTPYLPLEDTVEVLEGKYTELNITLVRPGAGKVGAKPHTHDEWGGETKKLLWTADVVPSAGVYSASSFSGYAYCPYHFSGGCEAPIPIQYDQHVPPGTGLIEVIMRWSPPAIGANEMGLRLVQTAYNKSSEVFIHRGPGDPFRIPVFPNEADPGHQRFTEWVFNIRGPANGELYHPLYPPVTTTTNVHIEFYAYKTVVPFEPQHQDFWKGRTEIPLVRSGKYGPSNCLNNCYYPGLQQIHAQEDGMVPPGTLEIRGTLTWENPNTQNQGTAWGIAYKGATSPTARPIYKSPTSATTSGAKTDFVIRPAPEDVDQFYQLRSVWAFSPDDGREAECGFYNACNDVTTQYGTTWTLSATAYKDPAYTPDF